MSNGNKTILEHIPYTGSFYVVHIQFKISHSDSNGLWSPNKSQQEIENQRQTMKATNLSHCMKFSS